MMNDRVCSRGLNRIAYELTAETLPIKKSVCERSKVSSSTSEPSLAVVDAFNSSPVCVCPGIGAATALSGVRSAMELL